SLICIALLIALSVGFPQLRTIDLFADNTVADADFSEGSHLMQLVMGSAFTMAGLLAWRHGRDAMQTLRHVNPFLLMFCLWAACTIFWSPYPVVTLKRAIQLVGVLLVGLCLCLPFVR